MQTIGIIGGGQLGKMTAIAASNLGFGTFILTDAADSPATRVCPNVVVAPYDGSMIDFARAVDYITYEFENINCKTLSALENMGFVVRPSSRILSVSQDRLSEKDFFRSLRIPTAEYVAVDSGDDLIRGIDRLGLPAILKQRRHGYDGKGQYFLSDRNDVGAVTRSVKMSDCILEQYIPFDCELSVIVARGIEGGIVTLPAARNVHKDGILRVSTVPSGLPCDFLAGNIAKKIACALDLIGILAVEMFYSEQSGILVNEMAPRPHNSGHWSMDCCNISQFELHVRAVADLPLVTPRLLRSCVMHNLIGDDVKSYYDYFYNESAKIYLYGKEDVRAGRKMGHVNIIGGEYENC